MASSSRGSTSGALTSSAAGSGISAASGSWLAAGEHATQELDLISHIRITGKRGEALAAHLNSFHRWYKRDAPQNPPRP